MRIAMLGTRGVPASYGGFETAVEEVGRRLVDLGHEVTVYCRNKDEPEYRGMKRVELPALRRRSLETLSHTALSALHAVRNKPDVALVFNAANAPLLPLLKLRRIPTAVHVDGLEWRRGKWAGAGKRYYMAAEALAVAWAHDLIADCTAIADYYRWKFKAESSVLTYGAPLVDSPAVERLAELGLEAKKFHLVVARLEPENNVDLIARGYLQSGCRYPLVVVGGNPYPTDYTRGLLSILDGEERIRPLGGIYDQELLDTLYQTSLTYLHGHSVGGTNPSLLRAMGAGATVVATGNRFNREVVGDAGLFFDDESELAKVLEAAETDPALSARYSQLARARAAAEYDWDEVAMGYEKLCVRLADRKPAERPGLISSLRRSKDARGIDGMPVLDEFARESRDREKVPTGSYWEVVARLRSAQKSAKGAPAYSRFVNRPLGRLIAAGTYLAGMTPNQVTCVSGAFTLSGIVALASAEPTLATGLLVSSALVLGYAFDSADGQLARLRGGGSAAGEWLDHVFDSAKIPLLHLAVAVSCYRFSEHGRSEFLLVPLGFAAVSTVNFFSMIISDFLRRARAVPAAGTPSTEPAPVWRALMVAPSDYGLLCLTFLLLGAGAQFSAAFTAAYSALAAANGLYLAGVLLRGYRAMNALDAARQSAPVAAGGQA